MPPKTHDTFDVVHVPDKRRFEVTHDGVRAWLDYIHAGTTFVIAHTEVPPALEGNGIGGALVRTAVRHAQDEGLTLVVICPFAVAYLRRHPELAPDDHV